MSASHVEQSLPEVDDPAAVVVDRMALLGWSVTHEPSREAYRLCTGEDAGPTLDRYLEWVEENLIGPA